jgi:hypothetical protein
LKLQLVQYTKGLVRSTYRTWGEAFGDEGRDWSQYIDIYNYQNGRIKVAVRGTSWSWIKVNGWTRLRWT